MSEFDHLAIITPVDRRESSKILSLSSLFAHSIGLAAFQAGWVVLIISASVTAHFTLLGGAMILMTGLAWLVMQFALVFSYPEWPLNRLLCWRLRNGIRKRKTASVSPDDPDTRVVELVPRERWRRLSMETATDLMLMRIDDHGVWMTGDRHEYQLPKASIIDVTLQSSRPPGWFTPTHVVILVVRTESGPTELPISYRDHGLGNLGRAKRQHEAVEMVNAILAIASGQRYQPPTVPASELDLLVDRSDNPYAPTLS